MHLLIDSCSDNQFYLNLNEASEKGLTKFRGKFQESDAPNKNKRIYTHSVLDSNVKALSETIKERGLIGELDHPTDSIVHFEKASHIITKLWWEGNSLMGEGEILNTPHGSILKSLINQGVRIGISSRGIGSGTQNENGLLVIGENYKLITFDAVADPSTNKAFQEKITKENFIPKNESGSINKCNKDVLKAYFSALIQKKANEIRSKI